MWAAIVLYAVSCVCRMALSETFLLCLNWWDLYNTASWVFYHHHQCSGGITYFYIGAKGKIEWNSQENIYEDNFVNSAQVPWFKFSIALLHVYNCFFNCTCIHLKVTGWNHNHGHSSLESLLPVAISHPNSLQNVLKLWFCPLFLVHTNLVVENWAFQSW